MVEGGEREGGVHELWQGLQDGSHMPRRKVGGKERRWKERRREGNEEVGMRA